MNYQILPFKVEISTKRHDGNIGNTKQYQKWQKVNIGVNFLQIVGARCPFLPLPSPSLPSPPFPFPLLPSPTLSALPSPLLRSKAPQIQLGGLGSAVSSPSGVWGGAPAEIEFGAF